MSKIRAFLRETKGATSIEYGLIGVFVSVVIVASLTSIGSKLNAHYLMPAANALS